MVPADKTVTFVFEMTNQKDKQKILFSNMYKKPKTKDSTYHFPITLIFEKYATLVFNLNFFLKTEEPLMVNKIKICSNIFLRNAFFAAQEL